MGIPIATTPGGSTAVVELIFGYMLAYSRKLILLDQTMRSGEWSESYGLGLEGKTVGVIGMGKIGSGVAKVAKAFNMNVLAWGPRLTLERAEKQGVTYTNLDELLRKSHYIVLAVRLVPETKKLLIASHFSINEVRCFFY